jgi:hypothetical protein
MTSEVESHRQRLLWLELSSSIACRSPAKSRRSGARFDGQRAQPLSTPDISSSTHDHPVAVDATNLEKLRKISLLLCDLRVLCASALGVPLHAVPAIKDPVEHPEDTKSPCEPLWPSQVPSRK